MTKDDVPFAAKKILTGSWIYLDRSHQKLPKVVPKTSRATKGIHLSAGLHGPTPPTASLAFSGYTGCGAERYSHLLERHRTMGSIVNPLRNIGDLYFKLTFLY